MHVTLVRLGCTPCSIKVRFGSERINTFQLAKGNSDSLTKRIKAANYQETRLKDTYPSVKLIALRV